MATDFEEVRDFCGLTDEEVKKVAELQEGDFMQQARTMSFDELLEMFGKPVEHPPQLFALIRTNPVDGRLN